MRSNPKAQPAKPEKLLRRHSVEELIGMSRSSIYDGIKQGTFPAPVRLAGSRSVAWRESDIAKWQAKCQEAGGQ